MGFARNRVFFNGFMHIVLASLSYKGQKIKQNDYRLAGVRH